MTPEKSVLDKKFFTTKNVILIIVYITSLLSIYFRMEYRITQIEAKQVELIKRMEVIQNESKETTKQTNKIYNILSAKFGSVYE